VASHATTINAVPASEGRQQGMYSSTGIGSKYGDGDGRSKVNRSAGVVIAAKDAQWARVVIRARVLRQIRRAARCARHLVRFLAKDIVGARRHIDALADVVAGGVLNSV
jgi:hypothetical protein